jgi:hypothetical protein
LIGGDSFLVLNLGLNILNGVRRLDIKSNGLSSEGLYKNLHTTSKSEDQVKSGFLLDVIVRESSSIFELLSGKDESLLIRRNTFLILNFCLDILNGVRGLNIKSNGLSSQSLDEDLHTTSKSEDQVKSGFLLDVIVRKSSSIFELLSGKDESLLIWGDTFLVLDLGLDILNRIRGLNVKSDGLSSDFFILVFHTRSDSDEQVLG